MSATVTTESLPAKAVKAFKPFVVMIAEGITSLRSAREAVATATLRLAYVTLDASKALVDAGATAEQAQESIISALGEDENGNPYSWKTVEQWHSAIAVARGFSPEVQEALGVSQDQVTEDGHRATFGVDALRAFKGIKDLAEREDLAVACKDAGVTAIRPVRQAVKEHKGTTDSSSSSGTTAGVEKLLKNHRKASDEYKALFAASEYEYTPELQDLIGAAVILGVRIGRNGNPTKAQRQAAETLCYVGPESDDEATDAQ